MIVNPNGKGLGKDEAGISKPIKCGLKFDKMGIGYQEKLTEETTNRWWEQAYNKAASNVTSTGTCKKKESGCDPSAFAALTDEELFKACGGRTAHKAARHGLHLGGKLERVEHQEKKSRKKRTRSECCNEEKNDTERAELEQREEKSLDKRKKKKKTTRGDSHDEEKNEQREEKLIDGGDEKKKTTCDDSCDNEEKDDIMCEIPNIKKIKSKKIHKNKKNSAIDSSNNA
ncbi:G patch domain-containing protein 4 [Planococcus citri]|uniref:G patch domain-containing protein 4 n=1 Tax=Planococcus citri TaxID=170843 RepID=UPI0031F8CFF7